MCGIAGIWGAGHPPAVQAMLQRLAHRGPDAEGLHMDPSAPGVIGHRRLAIVDPAGGDQPLRTEEGQRALVTNGEIYNAPDLRSSLARQHRFRTRSDSEVALHLFADLGPACARRFDGMFAIAITDGEDLFLARDPIGVKPLYWGRQRGTLCFASEMKALAGTAGAITEFPPGAWFHSRTGVRPYYTVPGRQPIPRSMDHHLTLVRETLEQAVAKRLMSDVPVGAFLSGGLDSSLIAALARRHLPGLHTFAVGTPGSRDLDAARTVARHLDTVHHEYVLTTQEVAAHLPAILYHLESYDQDLVRSAIPCYFAAQLAAREVKVILTGEGADELFAGYAYYREFRDPQRLHQELRRSVQSLHHINLQRVDRLTMAHGVEGRVPFLDTAMVEVAQTISPHLKLRSATGGQTVDKWILRQAFRDLLPAEIVWRKKAQFDEGSGTLDLLEEIVGSWMSSAEAARYRRAHPETRLRSTEECLYHKLLCEAFADPTPILANVARWADRPAN